MISSNLKYHDINFQEYLALAGYSYSGIKNEGATFEPTAKMQLGTDVHNYLLTPQEYHHENIKIVRPLAVALKQALGALLKFVKPEQAFTADFTSQGFTMPYKGRVDWLVPERIVVDIKVTELNIAKAIEYFGYDKQLSGYSIGTNSKLAIIASIHPKTLKTTITKVPISSDWWAYQVIQKGNPNL